MGTKKKKERENRDAPVRVLLTEDEKKRVEEAANAESYSVSQYVRLVLRKHLGL